MSSFEWMELQTLIKDIELSRSRLADARKSGDRGRAGALEEEIARAEKLRLQLLTHISTNIASTPETAPAPKAKTGADFGRAPALVAEPLQDEASAEQPPPAPELAPEPAPRPKARDGTGSRQASAPAAEALEDEASAEQPPPAPELAPEPAPRPKARDGAGSRQASAPVAEALQDEANAEQPLPELPSAPEPAPPPKAGEDAGSRQISAPVAEASKGEAKANAEQLLPDDVDRIVASDAASPGSARKADSVEGGMTVWNQLTPSDIERAKNELGVRRAEILAKHAEELKGLDAEQSQLDTLEQAIDTFLRNLNRSSPESPEVKPA